MIMCVSLMRRRSSRPRLLRWTAAEPADSESDHATECGCGASDGTQRYEGVPADLKPRLSDAVFDRVASVADSVFDSLAQRLRELPQGLPGRFD
jgi:hypothetical protein